MNKGMVSIRTVVVLSIGVLIRNVSHAEQLRGGDKTAFLEGHPLKVPSPYRFGHGRFAYGHIDKLGDIRQKKP
jgi:hypothetical protein